MRPSGRCALLPLLLLALGVAARETPELLELTEDTSNEGMVAGYENRLPEIPWRNLYPREPVPRLRARPRAARNIKSKVNL